MVKFTEQLIKEMTCLNRVRFHNRILQPDIKHVEDLPQDHGSGALGRRTLMSVFKKQGVYWIE